MPPIQDKTSNDKQLTKSSPTTFVFYSCIESMHRPDSDATFGEHSNISKKIPTSHQDHLGETSNEWEEHLHTVEDRKAEALL